jgi:hypothetical protein
MVRIGDAIIWADTPQELAKYKAPDGTPPPPKSVTFVPAKLSDNPALMAADSVRSAACALLDW